MNRNKSQRLEQFKDNCLYLGLKQLADKYQEKIDTANNDKTMGYYEFLQDIIQEEAAVKKQRHIEYLVKNSKLPEPLKILGDFDFDFQPDLDRRLIMDLASLQFLKARQSILLTSKNNGVGKSHIARSLALLACQNGYKTYYTTCSQLITDLNQGVFEKTLDKRMKKYTKPELLVVDEMGQDRLELQVVKEAHLLFKVIDYRYNNNQSIIFTTNVEEADWAEFLGDPITTSAIIDRLYHNSIIIKIKGESYRRFQSDELQKQYSGTENKPSK